MLPRMHATFKKQLASIVFMVLSLLAARCASAQNPAGYWSLDNGAAIKVGNSSDNSASKQSARIPIIDLSSTHAITVAFWSNRTYSTAESHALLESTADFMQSNTGFALFPDDSTCAGIQAAIKGDVGVTANCYSQPSSGVWHHIALVLDKTKSAGNQVALYIDGELQSPSKSLAAATNTNHFGNNPIYVSYSGTSTVGGEKIDDPRLYPTALSGSQINQMYSLAQTQIREDVVASVDSYGTMTTPSITTSANGELLVAFVAYDGPSGVNQTATVTGGGLTWALRSRSNHQLGTAEIWSAVA